MSNDENKMRFLLCLIDFGRTKVLGSFFVVVVFVSILNFLNLVSC